MTSKVALYSPASEQNKLAQVEKESLLLGQLLKDPKIFPAVLNPHIKCSIKMKGPKGIITKERFSPLTANLTNLLAENGFLSNTQGVISAFPAIMSVYHGKCLVW